MCHPLLVALGASALLGCGDSKPKAPPSAAPQPPVSAPARPFAASSFWNAPLPAGAPTAATSVMLVRSLNAQRSVGGRPTINTTRFSVPVYTVSAEQPKVRVELDQDKPELERAFADVPIPDDAIPAAGSDRNLALWQPSTDTFWDFFGLRRENGTWRAVYGGRLRDVSKSPGWFDEPGPRPWGAAASGLPLLGGLIRLDEWRRGRIDHAIAMALPRVRKGSWVLPARRTDGTSTDQIALQMGTRFRLDPNLDVERLPVAAPVKVLARAAQRYGLVVRDTAANIVLYSEDPTPTGTDPYTGAKGFFGGRTPQELLREFPWNRLVALPLDVQS